MARWTASAKWAAGPALDGQRDMPLALRLSEGLGRTACLMMWFARTSEVTELNLHRLPFLLLGARLLQPPELAYHESPV